VQQCVCVCVCVCVHLVDTGQFNFISAYLRRRQLSRTAAATAACGDESRWDGTWRSVPDVVPYGRAGPGGDHDVIIIMSGGDVTAADRPSVRSSLAGACASAAVVDTTQTTLATVRSYGGTSDWSNCGSRLNVNDALLRVAST